MRIVAEQGIALEYSEEVAPSRGMSQGGKIAPLLGQSPAKEFATLAPETVCELMPTKERRSSTTKRVIETDAVAPVVRSAFGLEADDAARDYVGRYGGDAKPARPEYELIAIMTALVLNAIGAAEPPFR